MIHQRTDIRGGLKLVRFSCGLPNPGQCAEYGGKYFAIAHHSGGIGSVIVRPGSIFDVPPGMPVSISAPVGKGFDLELSSRPIIVTGGLGFTAGLALATHFELKGIDYRMVSYVKDASSLLDAVDLLGIRHGGKINVWATSSRGRPDTPFDPIDGPVMTETPIFFAGPKDLYESCRSELDKRGLTDVRIRLNY